MEVPSYKSSDVSGFPTKPGVYRFYNKASKVIYVGKAKNLKARVSSYFNDLSGQNYKTRKMVSEIDHIEFTIVNSEFDALLLENNLIKSNQPKYNIMMRDDKSFPFILVVNEHFPRIYSLRNPVPGKGKYYGPYTSVMAMKSVLELIRNLYYIRTCNLPLTPENIAKGKFKVCLEYHIGKCKGPCVGLQDELDYQKDVDQVIHILKGNLSTVKQYFKGEMLMASEQMAFERAQEMKSKLEYLEKFQARSVIVNQNISDIDAFGIVSDDKWAYVNYIKITNGSIVQSQTAEVKKKLDEQNEEILTQLVVEMREKFNSTSTEVLTNIPLTFNLDVENRIPKIGDKKKLVDLALKNALYYKKEKYERSKPSVYREQRVLEQLQKDLQLKTLPEHIECFDNSNLQGTNPVASMVCFKKGKPSKKEYRKFKIKTVTGPDDFASMREVVFRRYSRLQNEGEAMPDLVVVDGGKGQLSSAVEAIKELDLYGTIPVIGIAKRLEEIYFPADEFPVHINKKSESLNLLQHLRNEAHRFAINFHRQQRSKSAIDSAIMKVEGIGDMTAQKLLQKFKSVKKLSKATLEEVTAVVGKSKAQLITEHFKKIEN